MNEGKKFPFTILELLLVIAVITILASLLLPALKNAKGFSLKTYCSGNLRQLGVALCSYLDRNQESFPPYYRLADPPQYFWFLKLQNDANVDLKINSLNQQCIFRCPANKNIYGTNPTIPSGGDRYAVNYAYNVYLGSSYGGSGTSFCAYKLSQVKSPSQTASMADADTYLSYLTPTSNYRLIVTDATASAFFTESQPGLVHFSGANILYLDNHVQYSKYKDYQPQMVKSR